MHKPLLTEKMLKQKDIDNFTCVRLLLGYYFYSETNFPQRGLNFHMLLLLTVMQLNKELTGGECIRISTGAAVPPSADAVVQVEDTQLLKATEDGRTELEIMILKAPSCGQDIR